MTKEKAGALWGAIIEYGEAEYEIGGEGNSGEFHDRAEQKKLERLYKEKMQALCRIFSETTRWTPVQGPSGWLLEKYVEND